MFFITVQHGYFQNEQEQSLLQIGTGAFHSRVHEWSCQLQYSPRLNKGWGKTNGEGLERIWSSLVALVAVLRYCTALHRLIALALRIRHQNQICKRNAGKWSLCCVISVCSMSSHDDVGFIMLEFQLNKQEISCVKSLRRNKLLLKPLTD